ncbi:hypothetical protein KUCAC02_014379 [Chaenocephalus aceratus]|uniref:Uncharacterized protein n=1 Tax=Chaenocephalus aceratus TaxID=36190 RepID=A0ACB9WE86_CHAAC|nr:hypothetical protein KUCAC02_014379 [Chaenocephalus aceratus]
MDVRVVLLILATTITATGSQMIYASRNPLAVGSSVTLFSQDIVTTGTWISDNTLIVFIAPGNVNIAVSWNDRVAFNSTTSSLTITSVKLEDSGEYTLQAFSPNNFIHQLTLSVQVPISNVSLTASATNLVEFNDTAVLRCSVLNGTSLSYVWMKGSSEVAVGAGVQLSDGGATLTMVGVTRYDEGSYRCNVSNGLNNAISPPVHLNIYYGPSNTTMTITPTRSAYITGSNITLSCSAESNPPAGVQWMFNGVHLNHFGPELQLEMVAENKSGNYKCILHNTFTSRFTSESGMIRILTPIVAVVVNPTGGPPILHEQYMLHCEVTGYVGNIQWSRNGQPITADNTTVIDMTNRTLLLKPVQLSDNGNYRCEASSPVSNMTSHPYTVEVNYGPMTPVIAAPSMALTGQMVTLNCSSDSHPPSHISWYFNGSLQATASELVIGPLTFNMSGQYTCMAHNNITGKNSSADTMLTILAPVTMASIKIVGAQPIMNHTFTLTCETAGSVHYIGWMYNMSQLHADNTKNISMDNATLTFNPVTNADNGDYRCEANNALSHFVGPIFSLEVFYGPHKPTIMGPSFLGAGDNAPFSCYASSNPPSSYTWFFNGSLVSNTSEYVSPPLTKYMSGTYTCMAYNNITGKNSTAYKMLTVLAPVTMASIKIVGAQPIENHTFTLTCETVGSVESVIWMYNWFPLYVDNRRNLSMDNTTLTFDPVMTSDDGSYQCVASNQFSRNYSHIFSLDVFYGPEMPAIMGPNAAKRRDNATFSCYASSNPPCSYQWFFNGSVVSNASEYVASLLTDESSVMYTCMAYNNITGKNSTAYKMLTVFDPIEDVQIETPMYPAIVGHFYDLTCNVTGTAEHFYWMKNGELLHEDNRTVFYMDNKIVTFNPLELNDTGLYECMALNPFWNKTSPSYILLMNYGPETAMIDGPAFAEDGHSAVFTCSAKSVPPSHYSWWFNGSSVANSSVFTTYPLSFNMSGEYTCLAYNNVTGNNSTNSKMLTVIEAISSVMIRSTTVPINSDDFTLTCDVSGPYDMIYWMKDNMHLNMTNSTANPLMSYHIKNNMLYFTPVSRVDDGTYECVATNQAGQHKSPTYMLLVNYGPLNVMISGPDKANIGSSVSLTCSAETQPDCDFHWFFNNPLSPNVEAGAVITFSVTKQNAGIYVCRARNPVTNIEAFQYKTFMVIGHASVLHFHSRGVLMLMGVFALSFPVLFN